jgi:hypothetical protein
MRPLEVTTLALFGLWPDSMMVRLDSSTFNGPAHALRVNSGLLANHPNADIDTETRRVGGRSLFPGVSRDSRIPSELAPKPDSPLRGLGSGAEQRFKRVNSLGVQRGGRRPVALGNADCFSELGRSQQVRCMTGLDPI